MNSIQQIKHNYTLNIICTMRGYAPEEVERWIDEDNDDYDADTASEYATISSILENLLTDYCEEVI